MENLTKKRTKAYFIDIAISMTLNMGINIFLPKKVKNNPLYSTAMPTLIFWGLELVQLRKSKQTVGYKMMGLSLEDQNDGALEDKQLIKRMAYRDLISSFLILSKNFERDKGEVLPHDRYALTVVKENE